MRMALSIRAIRAIRGLISRMLARLPLAGCLSFAKRAANVEHGAQVLRLPVMRAAVTLLAVFAAPGLVLGDGPSLADARQRWLRGNLDVVEDFPDANGRRTGCQIGCGLGRNGGIRVKRSLERG